MKKGIKRIMPFILVMAMVFSLLQVSFVTVTEAAGKNIVVYFPNWGCYNVAHRSIAVGDIPWSKVTVINHAFFTINTSNQLVSTDDFADFQKTYPHSDGWSVPNPLMGHFGEYRYYKTVYPNVKVLVSVGGWTRGENFHAMALTSSSRATFINSCIAFLQKYPFVDGIDLDWEYPSINRAPDPNDSFDRGCPGGPEDKVNFTSLLRELRAAFNANGMSSKLLTIAAAAGYNTVNGNQEPNLYAQYLNFINLMTYDLHGAWETKTNHHSQLYANPNDPSPTTPVDIKNKFNTDSAMKLYRDTYGVPASKLNIGTPYYSRGWKGVTGGTNGLFGNATGAATGTWDNPSSPGGQYPWFTLKTMENANGYVKYYDSVSKASWLYSSSKGEMLSYEDETSLTDKCNYVNSNALGGMIVWEISGDDAAGTMTNIIYNKLNAGGPTNTPTPTPTATPTATPTPTPGGPTATPTPTPTATPATTPTPTPATTPTPTPVATPTPTPSGAAAWAPNTAYAVNQLCTYGGSTYKCLQAHTSLVGWEPPVVPALWQLQ